MNISVELFAVRPGESNPCSVRSLNGRSSPLERDLPSLSR